MKFSHLILCLAICALGVKGSPLFEFFFGNTGGPRSGYRRRPKSKSFTDVGGGYNEYKRMCSVFNPHPYALIGSNPYPAVPFCPP